MEITPPDNWKNWYFEGEFFCSPNGDRFTPECILACLFLRQMQDFRKVLYDRPTLPQ